MCSIKISLPRLAYPFSRIIQFWLENSNLNQEGKKKNERIFSGKQNCVSPKFSNHVSVLIDRHYYSKKEPTLMETIVWNWILDNFWQYGNVNTIPVTPRNSVVGAEYDAAWVPLHQFVADPHPEKMRKKWPPQYKAEVKKLVILGMLPSTNWVSQKFPPAHDTYHRLWFWLP